MWLTMLLRIGGLQRGPGTDGNRFRPHEAKAGLATLRGGLRAASAFG